MSHLDPERLAVIATGGQPTSDEQLHIDDCVECEVELAELEHTVAIGRSTSTLGELETPPERVWARILDDVRTADVRGAEQPAVDMADARRAGSRRSRLVYTLAAVAAVIFVVAGVWGIVRPAQVVELASATLEAFPDHVGSEGQATVLETADGTLEVRVQLDADDADAGYREVWLITADASALVSLGVLDGSEGTFLVPDDIDVHDFVLVDISLESEDGNPGHSGDSVVRGELQFA
ncbi:anti-sigma factor [Planococcus sp. APC 4015]|nr:anti-sigma factor [Planococcus sp. APC 4015]